MQAGKNDIAFIYASITDADGTIIPDDKRAVTFTVEGDAELIGDNPRNAEAGISTILLMSGKTSGVIKVRASAEGLNSGELQLETR